jgi:hypothetical protein
MVRSLDGLQETNCFVLSSPHQAQKCQVFGVPSVPAMWRARRDSRTPDPQIRSLRQHVDFIHYFCKPPCFHTTNFNRLAPFCKPSVSKNGGRTSHQDGRNGRVVGERFGVSAETVRRLVGVGSTPSENCTRSPGYVSHMHSCGRCISGASLTPYNLQSGGSPYINPVSVR